MSYEIKFKGRDDETITVNNERGEKIKALVFDGNKDQPIDIDGNMYLIGNIKSVIKVSDEMTMQEALQNARLLDDGTPTNTFGKKCRGQYSIQKEINDIAKTDHPKDWPNKIRDPNWREKTRQELRTTPGVQWCDYKAKECNCD